MILQCEQCNTRFRLDDSKLKPGGVKVRCSKCRHVFIAGAETPPQEETDFDAILSGLGAPAPQPAAPPAPPAAEAAPAPPPEPPAEEHEEAAPEGAAAPPEFSFESFPAKDEPSVPAESGFAGVGQFSFEPEEGPEAGPGFAEEPAAGAAPPPTEEMAGFNEFSFDDEPSAKELEPPPSGTEVAGFQEFSFDEAPVAPAPHAEAVKAAPQEFDFADFSLGEPAEEPAVKGVEPAVASDFDFGEFSFDAEPEPAQERKPLEFDLSDFTFEGDADALLREESYGEAQPEIPSAAPAAAALDTAMGGERSPVAPHGEAPKEASFFSFGDELGGEAGAAPSATDAEREAQTSAAADEGADEAAPPSGQGVPLSTLLDFDKVFGEAGAAPHGRVAEGEEELPPLGIPSRHKRRPVATASLAVLSLLLLAALAGAGYYLMKSGPAAFERVGLGFVAQWFGLKGEEEGRVVVVDPVATFYQNKEAGELFVVTGYAENQFSKPRASIHVKVSIFDKGGRTLVQKTAYCGNRLSAEQLKTLPLAKIEAAMNNQFGDSLANLGVKPGEQIPFVVAVANVPKEAADFGVEVIGSTVAGQ